MPTQRLGRRLMPIQPRLRRPTKAAPERCVWGSDWPHPGEREKKPDDALLFDLLLVWAPDEKVRRLILVDNPAVLYDYPKSA